MKNTDIQTSYIAGSQKTNSTQKKVPEYLSPTNQTFEGPVRTLKDLELALIQRMGEKKGREMYDNFIKSILVTTFGTTHKDMMRAQKASKKMRYNH